MIKATVISDASFFLPTPHVKGAKKAGGWAAWVKVDGFAGTVKGYGPLRKPLQNSAQAEVYAALNGIWLAAQYGGQRILVRSDCMAVIQLIEGRSRSPLLLQAYEEAMARPDMRGIELSARHVKGHGVIGCAATYVNDWCDTHAKLAMKAARRGKKCQMISAE